jgi:membrane-bound lytic murein transglycosylase B
MANHRMANDVSTPSLVRALTAALGGTMTFFRSTSLRHRIRAAAGRGCAVATISPLVLAGAVAGAAPPISTPAPATPGPPVASVNAAPIGTLVVAAQHRSTGQHVVARVPASTSVEPPKPIVKSDIPAIALSAYRNAEHEMATTDPACGIDWTVLAGIGRVESTHAYGGITDGHGTAVKPIYGPVLDGSLPGNEIIIQSSAGRDVTFARAMGPMQFLPGTWAHYAADGDGDGVADPQNLYDSTLAAARYLCSGGLNLRDQPQLMSAVLRYNNSMAYARNVLGWAAAYASGVTPVDLPPLTGPPPPLADMHLENPEGLGPGLPLNIHGLPSTDPLAQRPLIDLGQPGRPSWQPGGPGPSADGSPSNCTVICIGSKSF